jgi:hypothetical protein
MTLYYRDSGAFEQAITIYQKRIALGGWEEEVWFSRFEIALIKETLKHPEEEVIRAYLDAYAYRPHRAEPLYHLARYLRERKRFALAYVYALTAANIPITDDLLFVSSGVYT